MSSICPYCEIDLEAPIAREWRFDLPGVVIRSANDAPGYQRRGYSERVRYKADLAGAKTVAKWAMRTRGIPPAERLRYVVLTRVYSGRGREYDHRNLHDKPIVDGLVAAGMLRDDSPQWARIWVRQVRGDAARTECHLLEPA